MALSSPQAADMATERAVWINGSVCMALAQKVMAVVDLVTGSMAWLLWLDEAHNSVWPLYSSEESK